MSTTSRRLLGAVADKAKTVDDRAYFAYLRAITERLAGNNAGARVFLMKSMLLDPDSRWAVKTRYELAGIELASGNWAHAEELARAEAVRLLAGDRKDRLAEVYQEFARQLLEPGDPLVKPDPNAAYDMLAQARELAKSPALRASILFAMGRASTAAANPTRAHRKLPAISHRLSRRSRPALASGFRLVWRSSIPSNHCWPAEPGPIWHARSSVSSPPSSPKTSPRFGPSRSTISP